MLQPQREERRKRGNRGRSGKRRREEGRVRVGVVGGRRKGRRGGIL